MLLTHCRQEFIRSWRIAAIELARILDMHWVKISTAFLVERITLRSLAFMAVRHRKHIAGLLASMVIGRQLYKSSTIPAVSSHVTVTDNYVPVVQGFAALVTRPSSLAQRDYSPITKMKQPSSLVRSEEDTYLGYRLPVGKQMVLSDMVICYSTNVVAWK